MVPIKEMTDVLKVVKETAILKVRQWVRIKRGVFKDDLAQVGSHFNLQKNWYWGGDLLLDSTSIDLHNFFTASDFIEYVSKMING